MLKNLKLTTKFSIILILIFIAAIAISGAALSKALEHRAEKEITSQALLLIDSMTAVRSYTSDHVNPLGSA